MAALCNRCEHYFCPVISIFFLLFFLAYNLDQRSKIACLPYFHTWCGLSANLECMSEMLLHVARSKCRTQKISENAPSGHHRTTLSDDTFGTKACIDNQKKNLLNSNKLTSCTCPDNTVNFGALAAVDMGHPCRRAVDTGVQNDNRVYSLWTVCTELKNKVYSTSSE